eukprot:754178-Hanusia_phi.AAC.1
MQVLRLTSFKLEDWKDEEPTTFFSIDFFAHETQVTNPVTGLEVSLGWSREFELEVDDVFLEYLERDSIILDLMRRTSGDVPFSRIASADLRLSLLMEGAGISNHRLNLLGIDGRSMGYVVVNIYMKDSIAPLVASYRQNKGKNSEAYSKEAQDVFRKISVPLDHILLNIVILRCQGLRSSRYGVLPWPYVQYELPGCSENPHTTRTAEKEGNPVFEDKRSWRMESPATALALRDAELELFVFDDNETDDLQAFLGLAKISLAPLFQEGSANIDGEFRLKDNRGVDNGSIFVQISWSRNDSSPAPLPAASPQKQQAVAAAGASSQDNMKKLLDVMSRKGHDHLQAFDDMDAKKDGVVDEDEFMTAMDKYSCQFSKTEVISPFHSPHLHGFCFFLRPSCLLLLFLPSRLIQSQQLFEFLCERQKVIDAASWHSKSSSLLKTASLTADHQEMQGSIVVLLKDFSPLVFPAPSVQLLDCAIQPKADLLPACDLLKFEVEITTLEERKQTSRIYKISPHEKSLAMFEKFAIKIDAEEQDVANKLEPIFSQSSSSDVHLTITAKGLTFDHVLHEKQVLGSCKLDLRRIWKEGKDVEELATTSLSKLEKVVAVKTEGPHKAAPSSSTFSKLKPGTGHIQLHIQQISLHDPSDPAVKAAGGDLSVSANFFNLQSAEEEDQQRSPPFDRPNYAPLQTLHLNHVIEFPIDKGHNEAHLDYFVRCLKGDEDRDKGAVRVLLLSSRRGEEGGGDSRELAVAELSVFDLFHLRPEDTQVHPVDLPSVFECGEQEYKCSARLVEAKTSRLMGEVVAMIRFQNLNIYSFLSSAFSPHELEKHMCILLKSVVLRSGAHVKDVENVSLVVDVQSCANYQSKAVFVKEISAEQKLRERFSLHEKILIAMDKYPSVCSKLAEGRRMEVGIKLISTRDSSVVAEYHESSLNLDHDLYDFDFELKDTTGQVAAVCKADCLVEKVTAVSLKSMKHRTS